MTRTVPTGLAFLIKIDFDGLAIAGYTGGMLVWKA